MITTRQISVDLNKEKLKLRGLTTKNIDAGVRVEPPKAKIKPRGVTSTTLADVEDIREKKRRDDIAVEKKAMMTEKSKFVEPSKELMAELIRKPWREMTDEEKKIEMKRRAAKAKETRERKKEDKK